MPPASLRSDSPRLTNHLDQLPPDDNQRDAIRKAIRSSRPSDRDDAILSRCCCGSGLLGGARGADGGLHRGHSCVERRRVRDAVAAAAAAVAHELPQFRPALDKGEEVLSLLARGRFGVLEDVHGDVARLEGAHDGRGPLVQSAAGEGTEACVEPVALGPQHDAAQQGVSWVVVVAGRRKRAGLVGHDGQGHRGAEERVREVLPQDVVLWECRG